MEFPDWVQVKVKILYMLVLMSDFKIISFQKEN